MSRGYTDLQNHPITFRGSTASYSLAELELLKGITPREAAFMHGLKTAFGGEIGDGWQSGRMHRIANAAGPQDPEGSNPSPSVFLDPEDIPFGEPQTLIRGNVTAPRFLSSKHVAVLTWTDGNQLVCKTKKEAYRKMRALKRLARWRGYKPVCSSLDEAIMRAPDGRLSAITLRVYDKPHSR